MTMLSLPDLAAAALAGPLLAAGAAKLLTPAGRLDWPVDRGPLRAPLGPRLAGAGEVAAAVAVVLAPGRWAAAVALVAYTVLTAAAAALRGRRCACFGAARLAAVGNAHLGLNASGALAGLALLTAAPPGSAPVTRAVVAALSAAVTYGLVAAADRNDAREAVQKADCDEQVVGVHLYVTDSCPACKALQELLAALEPALRDTITTTVVGEDNPPPPAVAELGVPCAVPLGAGDRPVCRPVTGIGAVKVLIDGVTIRVPAGGREE
jgi:hypothetical protein